MPKPISVILSPDPNKGGFLTVFFEKEHKTIREDDPAFQSAVAAYRAQEWDRLDELMSPRKTVQKVVDRIEGIEIQGDLVLFDGRPIQNVVVNRVLELRKRGLSVEPLIAFLARLMKNPSYQAIHSLYMFLEDKGLPITDHGTFIAYKSVKSDYTDHHTGKVSNKIGESPSMPRNECDDNRGQACSKGYHIGSFHYASTYCGAPRIMIVECDPADVVSVPNDAKEGKLRTCHYKVIGEMTGERKPFDVPVFQKKQGYSNISMSPLPSPPTPPAPPIVLNEPKPDPLSYAQKVLEEEEEEREEEERELLESLEEDDDLETVKSEGPGATQEEDSSSSTGGEKSSPVGVTLGIGEWAIIRDKHDTKVLQKVLKDEPQIGNYRTHRNYRKKEKLTLYFSKKDVLEELRSSLKSLGREDALP